jgi:hypothetical protein
MRVSALLFVPRMFYSSRNNVIPFHNWLGDSHDERRACLKCLCFTELCVKMWRH